MTHDPVTITMTLDEWRALLDSRHVGERGFGIKEQNARAQAYNRVDGIVRRRMRERGLDDFNARVEALRASTIPPR
jgi:hypothetical protein